MDLPTTAGGLLRASNVYCVGRNYAEHATELGNEVPEEPLLFLKSTAALRGLKPGSLAYESETFHHEIELVVIMTEQRALYSKQGWRGAGYISLGLDLTRRKKQSKLKSQGHPWTTAKSFAGSAIIAPLIPLDQFNNLSSIKFSLSVNQSQRQWGDTASMIFPVPDLIDFLCTSHELMAGDVIFTGTPKGVSDIRKGDQFTLKFEDLPYSFSGEV